MNPYLTCNQAVLRSRVAVVLSARVHPGETNSSHMMRGAIDFLTSDDPKAAQLREHFVFKLVPMINPDGVINGNYRTDLLGQDLNRRYSKATRGLQPTVFALKEMLRETHQKRGVLLFIDMHGHSRKKNVFFYGCDPVSMRTCVPESALEDDDFKPDAPPESVHARIFPLLASNMWPANAPPTQGYIVRSRLLLSDL